MSLPCSGRPCSCGRRARRRSRRATPASLPTGALSPVSAASCVSSVAERTTRPSAGTMSPASSWTRSPGTTSTAGTSATLPSRTTFACGTCMSRERVDALARLQLLARAEHEVEDDQKGDEDSGGDLADDEARDRDGDEHQVHRVAELLQGDRDDRGGHLALDLVRAVSWRASPPPRRTSARRRRPTAARSRTSAASRPYGGGVAEGAVATEAIAVILPTRAAAHNRQPCRRRATLWQRRPALRLHPLRVVARCAQSSSTSPVVIPRSACRVLGWISAR